jgi:hypothetical protein
VVAAEMGWLGKGMLGMAMFARPEMDMVNEGVFVGRERPGVCVEGGGRCCRAVDVR